jgi:nucleotide-binding universal stress UspA family protein
MFRTVLVETGHFEFAADRVRAAIGVAKRFDAMLVGFTCGLPALSYQVYDPALGAVAVGPDYTELDRERLLDEFKAAADSFRKATEGSGLETAWEQAFDAPTSAIVRAAVAADLIVLGRGDTSLLGNAAMPSAGDVVLHAGRPVLVLQKGVDSVSLDTVVVAWKDTREAQRAIADALPFLKQAKSVIVTEVDEGGGDSSLPRAAGFLTRHGVAAKTQLLKREGVVEDQLIDFATRAGAGLIVAGAYGRTRLREWIFGGMTRELLLRSPVPCFLSH